MVAILSEKREAILAAVQRMYTDVAAHPGRTFHFPTGRQACEFVGYPPAELDELPATALESFAGVGYPFLAGGIRPGDVVLDVGSGSGTDALIASRRAGPSGRVLGLDMTPAMLDRLAHNASLVRGATVEPVSGNAEEIPLRDDSADVVTSNGVINLVPDKPRAISEIFRVLRPGGRVQIADVVLRDSPSDACREHPELWAECIVGATVQSRYLEMFRSAGFAGVEVLCSRDYFSASASAETRKLAESLGGHAIVLRANRPA